MERLQPWGSRKGAVVLVCRPIGWLIMVWGFTSLFLAYRSGGWLRAAAIVVLGGVVNQARQVDAGIERRLARWRGTRK
jgi:hypothetical protein